MRLWSVHPRYLDRQALTACWRESLLAQSVLVTGRAGYRNHPQLQRFREHARPLDALAHYMEGVLAEADERGYNYNHDKVVGDTTGDIERIVVTTGQLDYEWRHLSAKLAERSPLVGARWEGVVRADAHPFFLVEPGPIASWERPRA